MRSSICIRCFIEYRLRRAQSRPAACSALLYGPEGIVAAVSQRSQCIQENNNVVNSDTKHATQLNNSFRPEGIVILS